MDKMDKNTGVPHTKVGKIAGVLKKPFRQGSASSSDHGAPEIGDPARESDHSIEDARRFSVTEEEIRDAKLS
ncbi:hypothetical protein CC78DRAFT_528928 [Lojkania enalia]|uniref:Uncharacterized protein n=1 Tax=Lojkania enalia TaxID=147567 RepID=A0A9P4TQT2_9PLEO|nr:hypothetical protein CC78DRAFT_528928 [Didymosphaeria enalia]